MQQISAFTGGGMGRKYKRLSVDDIHVLWSRWFQGDTSVQISAVLGCDKDTVTWHVVRGGGVRPPERRRAARHLTLAEREEISRSLAQGEGVGAVARGRGGAGDRCRPSWGAPPRPSAESLSATAGRWATGRRPQTRRPGRSADVRRQRSWRRRRAYAGWWGRSWTR